MLIEIILLIIGVILFFIGGALIYAGQYLYKEKFIQSGLREGLYNTSVSDYPENKKGKQFLIGGQICILVGIGILISMYFDARNWLGFWQTFTLTCLFILSYLTYSLYKLLRFNKRSPNRKTSDDKLFKGINEVSFPKNKHERSGGIWIRRTDSEIKEIKKHIRRSSLDPVMPGMLSFFISAPFPAYGILILVTQGSVVKELFIRGFILFFISLIMVYLLQLIKGRSFMKSPKFKICSNCQRCFGIERL